MPINFDTISEFFLQPIEPSIYQYPEHFGDEPDKYRWRAWWDSDGLTISLTAYAVVKKTPKGAWISTWSATLVNYDHIRWVADDSNAAWAKPTREEALRSLGQRLFRWRQKHEMEGRRIDQCYNSLTVLRPQYVRTR